MINLRMPQQSYVSLQQPDPNLAMDVPSRGLISRIDFLTLRLFSTILEEQSIARAAEKESIATSAVSKRISDLETALGTPLLVRHHKGISPTAAGKALLYHSRVVLHNLAQLEAELSDHAEGVRGYVRVVANDTTIFGYLPEELREFLAEHPKVRIEFEAKVSPDILKAVSEGDADIGLFAGDIPTDDLVIYPYKRDRLVAVVPEGHALAERHSVRFMELLNEGLIEQERGSSIERILAQAASAAGRSVAGKIRVASFDAMCRMVEAGLGVGVVPERFAIRIIHSMRVKSLVLDEAWAFRDHKICARDPNALPKAAQLLLGHLIEKAGGPS